MQMTGDGNIPEYSLRQENYLKFVLSTQLIQKAMCPIGDATLNYMIDS